MRISYNDYKTYKECAKHYLYLKVTKLEKGPKDQRSAIPGIVMQKVMEHFYNDQIYLQTKNVQAWMNREAIAYHSKLVAKGYAPWKPGEEEGVLGEYEEFFSLAVASIKEHKLLSKEARSEILYQQRLRNTDCLATGRIDFRIPRNGELWVVDGKATKYGLQYLDNDQLLWYAMLEKKTNGRFPDKLGWWLYRTGEVVWIDWSERDILNLEQEVVDATTKIKLEILELKSKNLQDDPNLFIAKPSTKNCRFCPFVNKCTSHQRWQAEKKLKVDLPELDGGITEIDL